MKRMYWLPSVDGQMHSAMVDDELEVIGLGAACPHHGSERSITMLDYRDHRYACGVVTRRGRRVEAVDVRSEHELPMRYIGEDPTRRDGTCIVTRHDEGHTYEPIEWLPVEESAASDVPTGEGGGSKGEGGLGHA